MTALTAGAVAVPALLLGGAQSGAAPINWEAIAQCESGGNWSANSGTGDYGGLQISQATWEDNGGVGLPSQSSPQQQIAVAQRVMGSQGPGAWPTCAARGDGAPEAAPVGSLTHFMTLLVNDADGIGGLTGD